MTVIIDGVENFEKDLQTMRQTCLNKFNRIKSKYGNNEFIVFSPDDSNTLQFIRGQIDGIDRALSYFMESED